MPGRLHPTDAQTYWMSAKIPNDQFLLFCFETDSDANVLRPELLRHARATPDLSVRIVDSAFGYPRIVPMTVGPRHIVDHGSTASWTDCLQSVASLFEHQVDPRETPWLVHLFTEIPDAPRCSSPAAVVVVQISHALGDGRVASAAGRRLLGDTEQQAVTTSPRRRVGPIGFVRRSRRAAELERRLQADTAAGAVPAQAPGRPKTRVDVAPIRPSSIRTVTVDRTDLSSESVTVTVGALTAVSLALSRYLTLHGDQVPAELGAEVTLAKSGERRARNHFRNAGVDLFPSVDDLSERARLISSSLADRLARAEHPAMHAQSLAAEMVPAILLRWGVRQFDSDAVPETVTGNTVVSSVARGPADLSLGGGPVRFTSGFPALSPTMSLTHGVHGIGDVVTIGITSSYSAVPDPDVYEHLIREAVNDVAAALARTARSG